MEFVRLKYANNKLINSDIKEHRDVINEYVDKKGFEYVGFIPVLLIFKKPVEKTSQKPVEKSKE